MAKDRTHGCNMHLPVCASQVACDGASVKTEGALCSKCRDKLAKKAKAPTPLRGQNTKISGAERRHIQKLKGMQ